MQRKYLRDKTEHCQLGLLCSYFACDTCECRCGFPLPPNYNPADHFVRTLAVESGTEDNCQEKIKVSDIASRSTPVKGKRNRRQRRENSQGKSTKTADKELVGLLNGTVRNVTAIGRALRSLIRVNRAL